MCHLRLGCDVGDSVSVVFGREDDVADVADVVWSVVNGQGGNVLLARTYVQIHSLLMFK